MSVETVIKTALLESPITSSAYSNVLPITSERIDLSLKCFTVNKFLNKNNIYKKSFIPTDECV